MALKPARLQWSEDGSLVSLDYGDIYFQRGQGLEESRHVFLGGNNLPGRFAAMNGSFHVAELGFGSGLNFLMTAQAFDAAAPVSSRLVYASIEKHPVGRDDLERIYAHFGLPQAHDLLAQYPPPVEGFHALSFLDGRVRLLLLFGDVAEVLPQLAGRFDAWYLDGFSPAKNPAMWDEGLYALLAARTRPGGTLATFSAAGHVRRGLEAAGFSVEKTKGYGVKRDMTVAIMKGAQEKSAAPGKIAILGAGIAGCAAAYALKQRGHDVVIVDRRAGVAQETSGNPVGILYPKLTVEPSPLGRFHVQAFCHTLRLAERLKIKSWSACGVVHLDLDEHDRARTMALLGKGEYPPELAAPTVYGGYSGLEQPVAGMLSPKDFCVGLAKDIPRQFGVEAAALRRNGDRWDVRDTTGEIFLSADAVVIAQGFASRKFAETEWLPLRSLRGQLTGIRASTESAALDRVICHDGYITPPVEGAHCIGATFQKQDPGDAKTRAEDDAENLEKLNRWLPELKLGKAEVVYSRAGYRATTPDKLPMIGPLPDYEAVRENFAGLRTGKKVATDAPPRLPGLYVATGFGAHGLSGAPLAGEIIAAMISDEPLPVPRDLLENLLPERFIFRGLKRKII